MSDTIALKFENVQKKYGDFVALKDVSFSVKTGEFFALLGPNGAGKTTLINCLNGLTDRDGGTILVNQKDPAKDPLFTKMVLGIVEQELTFDPFFSPFEILRLRRGLFGLRKDDAYLEWILEKLNLTDKRNAHSRDLSGGMKRRLMIAKALAHEPEILILDEPTAGVDVELRKNLYKFLGELQHKHKKTILLTTHYLEEAEALADTIAIQHEGEILVCEPKKKLLQRHNRMLEIEDCDGSSVQIEIEDDHLDLRGIVKKYPRVKNLHIREPKLEEIFLEMTEKKTHGTK